MTRPAPSRCLSYGALGLLAGALLLAACAPGTEVEPIPAPQVPRDQVHVSALGQAKGWVTVVAEAGTLPAATVVALRNEASGEQDRGTADAQGAFALAVPAVVGDGLQLEASGFAALPLTAAVPGPAAPRPPGTAAAPLVASPVEGGTTTVSCGAGCADPSASVVASHPRTRLVVTATPAADGSLSLSLAADPSDHLVLFAYRGEASSAPTSVAVPGGIDTDEDGFDAAIDCDDLDPARSPGASELCDALDNDCNGQVDEGCTFPPCVSDADCIAGQLCDAATGLCRPAGEPEDTDADGIPNDLDVCPTAADPAQLDSDGDGMGDACDADGDGDGSPADVDCDDLDVTRHPAAPELCDDGLDNDCDGLSDDGC